jgi:hypothetical protein
MLMIRLGTRDAAGISQSLQDLGHLRGVPDSLREDAERLAGAVRRKMDAQDLRMVAWLLRDASGLSVVPPDSQDDARYWASYLEGRLDPP